MNAEQKLAEMNNQDDEYLEYLRDSLSMQDPFGISRIQSMMRIGYNRAHYLVARALDTGILVRDSNQYLVKFNDK
ncbi:MAG: hypothetical protein COA78_12010 [Blastopirellula sp.]|nr:MAG: hypothetical protein COA78_12010 [Blastopirellula sp.]